MAQEAWTEATDPDCDPLLKWALEEALHAQCAQEICAMVLVAARMAGRSRRRGR